MTMVTTTEKSDFPKVLELINHVFGKDNSPIKMEDIFTDLLSMDNMAHMKIIKVDGKPVSVVNYLINEIDINGCLIKVAQMGAVCTHEDHRNKGYSGMILKNCLNQIRDEGVDLLYVSGDIDLYTKNDIHITGNMYHFEVEQNDITTNQNDQHTTVVVKKCSLEDIVLLYNLYHLESVKFIRDTQRFLDLTKRIPGAAVFNREAKLYCVEENGKIQGYVIGAFVLKENGDLEMEVVEYAGERQLVLLGILEIMKEFNLTAFSGYTPWFDTEMVKALAASGIKTQVCNYPGTIRIVNFTQLMIKLKPLYTKEKIFENIEFYEIEGKYIIRLDHMEVVIDDHKTMHNLILGNGMETLKREHIAGEDMLFHRLQFILPIPIPNPYNLNFI